LWLRNVTHVAEKCHAFDSYDSPGYRSSPVSAKPMHRCSLHVPANHIDLEIVIPSITILLRKEVIQPHLPIRLPCYDFTPIICPTFGSALVSVKTLDY
jgi:hypothetical protein